MKTVIFAKDVNLSKLVEMLKICPCCKYVSNLYQTITFTWLLRINTYLANICICPHFSRQRKCNANLELQIYHIFAPFANTSKSVFSSSEYDGVLPRTPYVRPKSEIYTPKREDEHPHPFHMRIPPLPHPWGWEVLTQILIFCGYCFCSAWFALWRKSIFFDLFWNVNLFLCC